MSKVNLDNNLFDYNNNRHDDETVSLASSFISSYNNNIDNNIKDLVDIINGGGKSIVKHRNKKPSSSASQCVLTTIKEQQQSTYNNNEPNLNMNIMPSDSVSNIGGNDNDSVINTDLYNELKNITTNNTTNTNNSMPNNDDINNSINKLSSILQHNNTQSQSRSFDKPIYKKQTPSVISNTKSIFDQNDSTAPKLNQDNVNNDLQHNDANSPPLLNTTTSTSTSIFDNNKSLQNDFIYTGGLENSDFYSNLLIALFVVFSFCVLGVSCICSLISPNVVYTFSFVLLICLFVIYIDKFK